MSGPREHNKVRLHLHHLLQNFLPSLHCASAGSCYLPAASSHCPPSAKNQLRYMGCIGKLSSGKEQALGSEPDITGIRERWMKRCVVWCAPERPSFTFARDVLTENRAQETEGFARKNLEMGTVVRAMTLRKFWILQIYLQCISVQCFCSVTRINARHCLKKNYALLWLLFAWQLEEFCIREVQNLSLKSYTVATNMVASECAKCYWFFYFKFYKQRIKSKI